MGSGMSKSESGRAFSREPQFAVNDRVIAVAIDNPHRGEPGVVVEVVGPGTDFVYRYHVRFRDGTTSVFFGFELDKGR